MEYNQFENNQLENDQAPNIQANSNINYVLKNFEELEQSYEKAKKVVSKEMIALWEMIAYERKQADVYRKKVQAGDVMNVILPFLSDIVNDVDEAKDLDELKQIIGIYIRSMRSHLKNIGVELKIHSENDILDPTERVGGSCRMTGDKSLDGRIIKTTQIGCVIHNEEPEEIQESVLVYKYDPELDVEDEPEVEPEAKDEPQIEEEQQTRDEESVFKLYDDQFQIITPAEETPVDDTPAEDTPAEETPAEDTPAEETPAEDTPAEETPAEDTPAEDTPAEDTPAEETPAEDTPAEDTPAEETPAEETPADDTPAEDTPADDTPADGTPAEDTPADDTPAEDTPAEDTPAEEKAPTIKATIDENGRYSLCECLKIHCTVKGNTRELIRSKPFEVRADYPYTFKPHTVASLYIGELCVVSDYRTEDVQKQLRVRIDKVDGKAVLSIKESNDIVAQFEIII